MKDPLGLLDDYVGLFRIFHDLSGFLDVFDGFLRDFSRFLDVSKYFFKIL